MKIKKVDRRTGKMLLILGSAVAAFLFLMVSNNLVKELANQERDRMSIWAQATERIAKANVDSDFEFLLGIKKPKLSRKTAEKSGGDRDVAGSGKT